MFGNSTATATKSNTISIEPAILKSVQDDLILSHPELIVRGLLENDAREDLKKVVRKEHKHTVKGDQDLIDYIVQETVGTGVIEDIIKDPTVTDIGYNGSELIIESNDEKIKYEGVSEITDEYIVRIIQKFANAVGKDFTPKSPILDAVFGYIRINAVHKSNSPYGTTMSMRIVRPKLALHQGNFKEFAPHFMYDFLEKSVHARSNIAIAGETGTGKTELQKLCISFVPVKQKVIMIEDVQESFVKEMFSEKDIYSWITSGSMSITKLLKAALRNNPRWIVVSETRGEEAYEMIQAVLSGHNIITSLHAINARAIPKRFINMAKIGYSVSEEALEEDIRRYFDFGVHVKMMEYNGKTVRYLSEVIEFNEIEDVTIFSQRFVDGMFISRTGKLSESFKERLLEKGITLDYPENDEFVRQIGV